MIVALNDSSFKKIIIDLLKLKEMLSVKIVFFELLKQPNFFTTNN
jgi:hypothetical protein